MKLSYTLGATSAVILFSGTLASFGYGILKGGEVQVPNTFVAGTTARASEVNANFQALADGVNANAARIDQNAQELADVPRRSAFVRVVAKSGGDFTTIAAALASITDAAAERPYRVEVAPGLYEEGEPLIVPGFVRLSGAGIGITIVRRAGVANSQSADAAVIILQDGASLTDLSVHNPGSSLFSIGVLGFDLGVTTQVDRIESVADGAGGTAHFAYLFGDSDLVIRDATGRASGAASVNAGFGSNDTAGPFAQMRIERCRFEANAGNTGFGMQIVRTAADLFDCHVFGSERAILATQAGVTEVQQCVLRSFSAVLEQTGSAAFQMAGSTLIGFNPIGIGLQFRYVHCLKSNYTAIVNGDGSSVQ